MKTEILSGDNPQSIDWGKVQLVVGVNSEGSKSIVLTSGKHYSYSFCGTIIYSQINGNKVGDYSETWGKSAFSPLPSPVTIKFEF